MAYFARLAREESSATQPAQVVETKPVEEPEPTVVPIAKQTVPVADEQDVTPIEESSEMSETSQDASDADDIDDKEEQR